ncbi:MAG TPA: hypothetical protein P5119_04300 [Candidatus Aminicenantes bacterium]|nr:hypothetical protein [Candidatus Aminicenantes bacterium]HRY64546.1 hypothetical protein [Candidatus Aminicenantes bacterium]HRZ71459.1 hypothetical protein [Candidatus Aminicenantes bacterium]
MANDAKNGGKIGRRAFLRTVSGAALPTIAVLGLGGRASRLSAQDAVPGSSRAPQDCGQTCVGSCRRVCKDTCEADCTGGCKNACARGCNSNCTGGCKNNCATTCNNNCEGFCKGQNQY